jgi:hypothetical protein
VDFFLYFSPSPHGRVHPEGIHPEGKKGRGKEIKYF